MPKRPATQIRVRIAAEPSSSEVDHRRTIESFLQAAHRRLKTVKTAEAKMRQDQQDDLQFFAGEQWPTDIQIDRKLAKRPMLTSNRLKHPVSQEINELRRMRPGIHIRPIGGRGDEKIADVFQGVVRQIERTGGAEVAYLTAAGAAVKCGRGYFRIVAEWVPGTWRQRLRFKRVRNPFTVWMDPSHEELDGRDVRFGFVIDDMLEEEYLERFPGKSVKDLKTVLEGNNRAPDWMPSGRIRVAEYWYVEMTEVQLYLIESTASGQQKTFTKAERQELMDEIRSKHSEQLLKLPKKKAEPEALLEIGGFKQVDQRKEMQRQVKWALINGSEVLDGNEDKTAGRDWPGKWIPIFPVIGEEIDLNGQIDYRGMIRDAKDPQRTYNYWNTAATEAIALAPKAPWLVEEGQLEGHEKEWSEQAVRNRAVLRYKATSLEKKLVPAPQRIVQETPIQAMTHALAQADNDIKATTQRFDASLGQRGPQESGKAIVARQRESELGTSHYGDNFALAVQHAGRVLVDLIPHYYAEPEVLRIIGADEKERSVLIHADNPPPELAEDEDWKPEGVEGIYNLAVGEYDVTATAGPGKDARRAEMASAITQFLGIYPDAFPLVADLLVESQDWPGKVQISRRLKRLLPEDLQDDTEGQEKMPEQVRRQLEQLGTENQELKQIKTDLEEQIRTEQSKLASEAMIEREKMASRERIEAMKAQVDLIQSQAKIRNDQGMKVMESEVNRLGKFLDQLNTVGMEELREETRRRERLDEDAIAQGAEARQAALAPAAPAPPEAAPKGPAGQPTR